MVKIIFIFLMVFTICEKNKILAANQVATVDQVVTFLDKYQSDIEKAVEKISNNKKIDKQKKIQYYFKRIFSRSSNIWIGVAQIALLFTERQKDFYLYLKNSYPNFEMNKTSKIMIDIYKIHSKFQLFGSLNEEKDTEKSIQSFVKKNIDNYIPKKLNSLYDYILKYRSGFHLLDHLSEAINKIDEKERCDEYGSPQDKFYNLYLSCLSIELLAMTSMINSYGFQELIKPNSKNKEKLKNIIDESKERMTQYTNEFATSIATVSIRYRFCDPYEDKKHERGVTFIEMAGLYQNILMYSYRLGHKRCSICEKVNLPNGTGNTDCYIQRKESTPWDENGAPQNFKSCTTPRDCNGKIHRCKTIWTVEYCMLKDNARRYKWVRDAYTNKVTYADSSTGCNDGVYVLRKHETKSYPKGNHCPFCWCSCDDTSTSSKLVVDTISLLPSMSFIAKNRVVTSTKMVIQDNFLSIQVEDGVIGPNYLVDSKTVNWVKLPEIKDDIRESRANGGKGKLKRDTDYVVWDYAKNAVNMDEILVEYGRVITGLKFGINKEMDSQPDRIQIQVHSTMYDWKSGKLLEDTGKWHHPDGNHTKWGSNGNLSPLRTNKKTVIDSESDNYFSFISSDPRTDAAQTTVPLIEAYDVGAETPTAFSGIGLHRRSVNAEYGGFFGLNAYSIDYSKYMEELTKK